MGGKIKARARGHRSPKKNITNLPDLKSNKDVDNDLAHQPDSNQPATPYIARIKDWQASLALLLIGAGVFFRGLRNPFWGDDMSQVVNNPVVHSLRHIPTLFNGSTFYNGGGIHPLDGAYYRPLMSTIYTIIYSIFGPHVLPFHVLQLLVVIGSAILLYKIFKTCMDSRVALVLAAIFLVHPGNSQIVFAIASMGDAMYMFFGLLGIWTLLTKRSPVSLGIATTCFFISILFKESGILFIIMSLLFLVWFDKVRLKQYMGWLIIPSIVYATLRWHAVGLLNSNVVAPIDRLDVLHRLLNVPSVLQFYVFKFIFPVELASAYYWTYTQFSFQKVLLPLIVDLSVISLVILIAYHFRKKASQDTYQIFLFFAIWAIIGFTPLLQFFPLDLTACETWLYFPMIGLLGIIGTLLTNISRRVKPALLAMTIIVICTLGARTILRASDWSSSFNLAKHDIVTSKEDYNAYNNIASYYLDRQDYLSAEKYAQLSINYFPTYTNYRNLGSSLTHMRKWDEGAEAFNQGLKYGDYALIYEDLGELQLVSHDRTEGQQFLTAMTKKYPGNYKFWMYLSILYRQNNNPQDAKVAMLNAIKLGPVPTSISKSILNDQKLVVSLPDDGVLIAVP